MVSRVEPATRMSRPGLSVRIEEVAREVKKPAGSSPLFATEESILKNRQAFVIECHETWKRLHDEAVKKILFWEGFLRREQQHPIGLGTEQFAEYNRAIWRRVNDSIVWSLVGQQRHIVKRICLYRPRGYLSESNVKSARAATAAINANPTALAIWNDATTCVDLGDLTHVRDGMRLTLEFIELKAGKVNEEVIELIDVGESEFDTRFSEFASRRGKGGVKQYKRVRRQKEISEQALTLLVDDKGINPLTGLHTSVLDLGNLAGETYDKELGALFQEVLEGPQKEAPRLVADCVWVYVNADQNVPWPEVGNRAQNAISAEVPQLRQSLAARLPAWDRDRIVSLSRGFAEPLAKPIFLRSFDPRVIAAVTCGDLMFRTYLYVDWERFAAVVRDSGAEFSWSDSKAARRARSIAPVMRPPLFGGKLAQIRVGDALMMITDPNIVQILFDGITPKSLVTALIQTAQMIKDDPSVLPVPGKWL
jgi:hypothetical protein